MQGSSSRPRGTPNIVVPESTPPTLGHGSSLDSPIESHFRKRTASSSAASSFALFEGGNDGEDFQQDDEEDIEPGIQTEGARGLKRTRRAVQNRLAQRAFRERKEHYMRDLEQRSQAYDQLQAAIQAAENRAFEVDRRAQVLAERAITLDARESAMRSQSASQLPATTDLIQLPPVPLSLAAELVEEWQQMASELMQLRRSVAEKDVKNAALRRAYEELSLVHGQLRQAQPETSQGPPRDSLSSSDSTVPLRASA